MAVTTFIPELWSARLQYALEKNLVAANLVNRDYEGQIAQQGDKVHINTITNVAVKTYTKGTAIADPDELTTTEDSLEITEADYFNFMVHDVDKVQAAGDLLDTAMSRAAYALADNADAYLLKTMASGGTQVSSSAVALTKDNVYTSIVSMRTKLDKANVPTAGRFIVVTPEVYALLLQDTRFVEGGGTQAEATVRNGLVGSVAGFTVYESNNVYSTTASSTTTYQLVAGVSSACTYAEQISETEAYRPEKAFSDAVKGLHLYGALVTDAAQLAVLKVTV